METQIIKASDFNLDKKQAVAIETAFAPKIAEREVLTQMYNEIIGKEITAELSEEADALRKKLVKVRIGIAAIHKTQKAFALAYGKFCDEWKNKETLPITDMESNLLVIVKFKEQQEAVAYEILNKERQVIMFEFISDFAFDKDYAKFDKETFAAISSKNSRHNFIISSSLSVSTTKQAELF